MKLKKIIYAAIAAANAVSVGAWVIMTAVGSSMAQEQSFNYAADRWDSSGGSSQVSCYFTEDAGFTINETGGVRAGIYNALKNISVAAEDGQRLVADAYSTPAGKMELRGDGMGRTQAEITAFGGDFFLFRDFRLLNGAYISESDLMQDGAVIDRRTAWELYGSVDVSGMNIYINGIKFYISGVVEDPQSDAEKKTAGDIPRAYVTYEGWKLADGYDESGDYGFGSGYDNVSCYECVVPSPVENFGYNKIKEYFAGSYDGSCSVVHNTVRFDPSVRAKKYIKLSDYAVHDKPVVYPWWENASRITEFKLSSLYHSRRYTYIIPILTLIWLAVMLWRIIGQLKRKAVSGTVEAIKRVRYNKKQE